jgi:hypothetical protein
VTPRRMVKRVVTHPHLPRSEPLKAVIRWLMGFSKGFKVQERLGQPRRK